MIAILKQSINVVVRLYAFKYFNLNYEVSERLGELKEPVKKFIPRHN